MHQKPYHVTIEVVDPGYYGINYDTKNRQWYFKLTSDTLHSPRIGHLSSSAKILFLDIILHSLRERQGVVNYCLSSGLGKISTSLDLLKGYLRELNENNIIRLQTKLRREYIEEKRIVIEKKSIERKTKSATPLSPETDDCAKIIDYLNKKTGRKYRHQSQKTKKLINARLNEKYNRDDFMTVIDNKCQEWLSDEEMNIYLRPETLFGTKFESYLNQSIKTGGFDHAKFWGKEIVRD